MALARKMEENRDSSVKSSSTTGRRTSAKQTRAGKNSTAGKRTTGKRETGRQGASAKGAGKKNSSSKGRTASERNGGSRKSFEEMNAYKDTQAFEQVIIMISMGIIALLLYVSYFSLAGKTGRVIGGLMFGILGWFAWFFPIVGIVAYVFSRMNQGDSRVPRRLWSGTGVILSLLTLSHLLFNKDTIIEYYKINHTSNKNFFACMYASCDNVMRWGKFNGGILGEAFGSLFSKMLGRVGAVLIVFGLLCLFGYIFYGVEMMAKLRKRNAYRQEMQEVYEQVKEDEAYIEPSYRVFPQKRDRGRKQETKIREMEKVPKRQSFDLREQARLFSNESEEEQAAIYHKEEILFPNEIEEKIVPKEPEKEEKKEAAPSVSEPLKMKEEPKETKVEEVLPIYRNELEEKFGSKKSAKIYQPVETVRAHEPVISVNTIDTEMTEQEPEVEKTAYIDADIEKTALLEADKPDEKESVFDEPEYIEETEEAFISKKPMDSFAPKDEVDIVPMSQKKTEAARMISIKPATETEETVNTEKISLEKAESVRPDKGSEKREEPDRREKLSEKKPEEKVIPIKPEKPYEFPPIDLLEKPKRGGSAASDEELRETAKKLEETLESFNVHVKMGGITCGPTVTRFELLPEQGVRVNKITNLADDLKLTLAAPSIRIEAPIPGKAAVGIEVPNTEASPVSFRELLEGEDFSKAKSSLTFAVGKDIAGKVIMADIAKMPHLLIAGATGSGKSVCINTLIMSILYKADPKDVKLIMIDPKVVELSCYNGIPHLFCPVVTDPKEAAASLNWAVREMMDRYNKFKELNVRNIAGYNDKIKRIPDAEKQGYEKLPYLVVIVDEFADLMMVASKEVEDAVCRLAQLARAAGIHLVLATQRPSVNVITGVIKANIPSRIAFSVSSTIDSRTILDKGGAEKLLGKGDMLFFPSGYTEPVRVQGAFVSDKEVNDVVEFLCSNNETPEYNHAVTEIVEAPAEEAEPEKKPKSDRDEYFEDAGRFVIESERAAAGQLQRHFSIGFNRAGRIIDQLHKAGVVGPAEGTKPRKVLMTVEEFEQMISGGMDAEDASETAGDMFGDEIPDEEQWS